MSTHMTVGDIYYDICLIAADCFQAGASMPLEVIDTLMEISLVAEKKMISPSEIIMTLGVVLTYIYRHHKNAEQYDKIYLHTVLTMLASANIAKVS